MDIICTRTAASYADSNGRSIVQHGQVVSLQVGDVTNPATRLLRFNVKTLPPSPPPPAAQSLQREDSLVYVARENGWAREFGDSN